MSLSRGPADIADYESPTNEGVKLEDGDDATAPVKRKVACMACRNIKLRCLFATEDAAPLDPCRRCTRLNLDCIYKPKRRPAKPGQQPVEQPVLGKNGLVSAAGNKLVYANGEASLSGSEASRKRKGRDETPDGYSPAYERRRQASSNAVSIPSMDARPATFSWSNFDPQQSHNNQLGMGPTTISGPNYQRFPGNHVEIDPILANYKAPSDLGSFASKTVHNYGNSGFALTKAGDFENVSNERNIGTGYDSMMIHQVPSPSLIPRAVDGRLNLMDHGFVDTPANTNSCSSNMSHTPKHDKPTGRSPSPDSEVKRYPMSLTSMLDIAKKGLPGSSSLSARGVMPVSAERDHHHDQTLDTDNLSVRDARFPPRTGASDPDRYDEYSEGNQQMFDRPSYDRIGSMNSRDSTDIPGHRSKQGNRGEVDDEVRKRMRWDDQAEMDARRRESTTVKDEGHHLHQIDRLTTLALTSEEARNKADRSTQDPQEIINRDRMEDPVTLGLLSAADVPLLFDHFHNKLNTYIALLDPILHSPAYTLANSPILFTAILTVSAQCYMPELHKPLRKRVDEMLGIAFARGDAEIGICQALSLLGTWKEPNDSSSWLKLGYAIRVAFELGLDAPHKRPLPSDETRAREILNGERTFLQLAAFDRTMYMLHGRGERMISPGSLGKAIDWAQDHPEYYCYSDAMLAASSYNGELPETLVKLRIEGKTGGSMHDTSFKFILHNIGNEIRAWRESWFGDTPPAKLHPISAAIVGFYDLTMEIDFLDRQRQFIPHDNRLISLSRKITLSIRLLRYIVTDLSPHDVILFAPDVITFQAVKSAVFLAKSLHRMDSESAEDVQQVFQDLARECRRVARGQNTPFHQARFFASLMRISSVAPTRIPSRALSPKYAGVSDPHQMVTPELLADRLNGTDPTSHKFSVDQDMVGFNDPQTIEGLLEDSQDWFSTDVLANMNLANMNGTDWNWAFLPNYEQGFQP